MFDLIRLEYFAEHPEALSGGKPQNLRVALVTGHCILILVEWVLWVGYDVICLVCKVSNCCS